MNMYRASRYELMQYSIAEQRYEQLRFEHQEELEQAYGNIHPTRTQTNYDIGEVFVESMDPANYAIYLVELQEDHKKLEAYFMERADLYGQALSKLTKEEIIIINAAGQIDFEEYMEAENKLIDHVSKMIMRRPELKRDLSILNELDDMEQYDKTIEEMKENELLEGYEDPLHDEDMERKIIYQYSTYKMAGYKIAEILGITKARVNSVLRRYRNEMRGETNSE